MGKYLHDSNCLVHDTGGGVCDCERKPNPAYTGSRAERRAKLAKVRKGLRARARAVLASRRPETLA